jgi:hypothetical protein
MSNHWAQARRDYVVQTTEVYCPECGVIWTGDDMEEAERKAMVHQALPERPLHGSDRYALDDPRHVANRPVCAAPEGLCGPECPVHGKEGQAAFQARIEAYEAHRQLS